MLPNSQMVRERMETNSNIAQRPWRKEPGEEALCLRLETPKPDIGFAVKAARKAGIGVSSVGDTRKRMSQPATSGREGGKHLFGVSLGAMDMEIISGVSSEAPEITNAPVLQEQVLCTTLTCVPGPNAQ